ncbi:hypothetical protein Tcan_15745 [Toxocara canis]|uniref:Uncharacterized protein n=1 Tax=Toxocara canis TaxID=6265 RepID=A0A0B2VF46_TOXCA|nr:hypothetical protein Tcan_15745 [Toxocara canis]
MAFLAIIFLVILAIVAYIYVTKHQVKDEYVEPAGSVSTAGSIQSDKTALAASATSGVSLSATQTPTATAASVDTAIGGGGGGETPKSVSPAEGISPAPEGESPIIPEPVPTTPEEQPNGTSPVLKTAEAVSTVGSTASANPSEQGSESMQNESANEGEGNESKRKRHRKGHRKGKKKLEVE